MGDPWSVASTFSTKANRYTVGGTVIWGVDFIRGIDRNDEHSAKSGWLGPRRFLLFIFRV